MVPDIVGDIPSRSINCIAIPIQDIPSIDTKPLPQPTSAIPDLHGKDLPKYQIVGEYSGEVKSYARDLGGSSGIPEDPGSRVDQWMRYADRMARLIFSAVLVRLFCDWSRISYA
jgi:hypothetical protein